LKDAGVLRDRRVGRWVYYGLNPTVVGEIESAIVTLRFGRFEMAQPMHLA
jgi:DNA-binding transcriptional ArsR family regulator